MYRAQLPLTLTVFYYSGTEYPEFRCAYISRGEKHPCSAQRSFATGCYSTVGARALAAASEPYAYTLYRRLALLCTAP